MKVEGDEQIGIDIIKRACEEPIRQIVNNAGVEGAIIIGKIRENDNAHFGYNAQTDVYEDLVKSGVIDLLRRLRARLCRTCSVDCRPHADNRSNGLQVDSGRRSLLRLAAAMATVAKAWTTKPVPHQCSETAADSRRGARGRFCFFSELVLWEVLEIEGGTQICAVRNSLSFLPIFACIWAG